MRFHLAQLAGYAGYSKGVHFAAMTENTAQNATIKGILRNQK